MSDDSTNFVERTIRITNPPRVPTRIEINHGGLTISHPEVRFLSGTIIDQLGQPMNISPNITFSSSDNLRIGVAVGMMFVAGPTVTGSATITATATIGGVTISSYVIITIGGVGGASAPIVVDAVVPVLPELEGEYELLPELNEEYEVLPELNEEYEALPELNEEYEVLPELNEEYEALPELNEEYEVLPELNEEYEVLPELNEEYEVLPELNEEYEILPELNEEYEVLPELNEEYEVLPELNEGYEILPELNEEYEVLPELNEEDKIETIEEIEEIIERIATSLLLSQSDIVLESGTSTVVNVSVLDQYNEILEGNHIFDWLTGSSVISVFAGIIEAMEGIEESITVTVTVTLVGTNLSETIQITITPSLLTLLEEIVTDTLPEIETEIEIEEIDFEIIIPTPDFTEYYGLDEIV